MNTLTKTKLILALADYRLTQKESLNLLNVQVHLGDKALACFKEIIKKKNKIYRSSCTANTFTLTLHRPPDPRFINTTH